MGSKAPNYDGDLPGAGERMGPTWQAIWDYLETGKWTTGKYLASTFSDLVRPNTIYGMLRKASENGAIEKVCRAKPGRNTSYLEYRRTDSEVKKIKNNEGVQK